MQSIEEPNGFSYGHFVGEVNNKLNNIQNSLDAIAKQQGEQIRFTLEKIDDLDKRMQKKLETMDGHIIAKVNTVDYQEEKKETDKRISELEKWRYYLLGAFAVGSVAVSFLAPYITSKLFPN